MQFDQHQSDNRALRRDKSVLGLMVGGLVASQLASLVVILNILGAERTIIVPPTIERTFWINRQHASREYLEQMAAYVAWLVLDVSPAVIAWKRDALLDFTAPGEHAAMKLLMDLEADRLRANNAETSFLIQQLVADEREQAVTLTGRLRRRVNGQDIGEPAPRHYRVQFVYAGGRVHVSEFKEIDHGADALRLGTVGGAGGVGNAVAR